MNPIMPTSAQTDVINQDSPSVCMRVYKWLIPTIVLASMAVGLAVSTFPLFSLGLIVAGLAAYMSQHFPALPIYLLLLIGPFANFLRIQAVNMLDVPSALVTGCFDLLTVWIICGAILRKIIPRLLKMQSPMMGFQIGALDISLCALIILATVHIFTAGYLELGLYSFKATYVYILLLFAMRAERFDAHYIWSFVHVLLGSVLLLTVHGLYQVFILGQEAAIAFAQQLGFPILYYHGIFKMPYLTGSNNTSAWLMALAAVLTLALLSKSRSKFKQMVYLMAFVLYSVGLILTMARGGWLAYVAGFAFMIAMDRRRYRLAFAIGLLSFTALFVFPDLSKNILTFTIKPRLDYDVDRMNIWRQTISDIAQNPFGTGLGTQGWISFRFANILGRTGEGDNWYLKTTAEVGLLAIILIGLSWASFIMNCIQASRRTRNSFEQAILLGVSAAFVGFSLTNLGSNGWDWFPVNAFFWLLMGWAMSIYDQKMQSERKMQISAPGSVAY